MSNHKTRAVVVDNRRWGENKNRVLLFTEIFGKISVYLTGYGKMANHWGGVFEGGNVLEISLIERRKSFIVSGWQKVFIPDNGRFSQFLLNQIVLESSSEVIPFDEPNENLFRWAVWALKTCSLSSVCVYLSRLIYEGGFFDFSRLDILPILKKNFKQFLSSKGNSEIFEMIERQVRIIENFTGRPLVSFRIFSEQFHRSKFS